MAFIVIAIPGAIERAPEPEEMAMTLHRRIQPSRNSQGAGLLGGNCLERGKCM